ncbi:MAG: ribonuclease P protein component [Candidatus Hinthialibacter antarcticus]|nr:ribonuclease P protein component [Candidatus Hinthialibacter antarcticus]
MNERFQTKERLRKNSEIREVLKQPGTRGRFMTVHFKNGLSGCSRFAVVAGRVVGNAVTRNRAKRRLRELFRRNKNDFAQAVDLVVRVKPAIRNAGFEEIEHDFLRILDQRNVRNRPSPPQP